MFTAQLANTGKTPCKYGPVFVPYLDDWTLYGINTVQKWVRIYMAFFLCKNFHWLTMLGQTLTNIQGLKSSKI